jgi:hypothetical protein
LDHVEEDYSALSTDVEPLAWPTVDTDGEDMNENTEPDGFLYVFLPLFYPFS